MNHIEIYAHASHTDITHSMKAVPVNPDSREVVTERLNAVFGIRERNVEGGIVTTTTLAENSYVAILAPGREIEEFVGLPEDAFSTLEVFWQVWENYITRNESISEGKNTIIASKVGAETYNRRLIKTVTAHSDWYLRALQNIAEPEALAERILSVRPIKRNLAPVGILLEIEGDLPVSYMTELDVVKVV